MSIPRHEDSCQASYPELLSNALQTSNCCHEGNDKTQDAQGLADKPLPGV